MPWSANKFKETHWPEATLAQAAIAARTANAVLSRTKDEGKAVRLGISVAKKRNNTRKQLGRE